MKGTDSKEALDDLSLREGMYGLVDQIDRQELHYAKIYK